MKTVNPYRSRKIIRYRKPHCHPYPNAAEKQYYRNKLLDYALAAATCLGAITVLLVFITTM